MSKLNMEITKYRLYNFTLVIISKISQSVLFTFIHRSNNIGQYSIHLITV